MSSNKNRDPEPWSCRSVGAWAERYGCCRRVITQLRREGAPLESPSALLTWWTENKRRCASPWLVEAADRATVPSELPEGESLPVESAAFDIPDAPDFGIDEQLAVARAMAKGCWAINFVKRLAKGVPMDVACAAV